MFDASMTVEGFDDEIFAAIQDEERRQEEHIELIASENYASPRVMQAQDTVLNWPIRPEWRQSWLVWRRTDGAGI